jgi:hypothetical protein
VTPQVQKATDTAAVVTSLTFWGITLSDVEVMVRIAVGAVTFVSLCLLCAVYLKKLRSKA